jgi:hypothetical protein
LRFIVGDPLKFPGNWGIVPLHRRGRAAEKQPTGEYLLSYTLGGKKVSAVVKPSGGDLFDKNIFRAMKAPQNLLKVSFRFQVQVRKKIS